MDPAYSAGRGRHRDTAWVAFVVGFLAFFVLEQFLHWHHCHRHQPLGYLILLADGVHNLIGGLAVGSAFVIDVKVGLVTWLVAAAHEVPQELGDVGVLVHSGWERWPALAYNFLSGLTFLLGGLVTFAISGAWTCPCSSRSPPATSTTSPRAT